MSFCLVLFLHSMLRFCCDKTLLWKPKFEGILNSKILNIQIFSWSADSDKVAIILLYKIYLKIISLLKLENVVVTDENQI